MSHQSDLNRQPAIYKTAALPIELQWPVRGAARIRTESNSRAFTRMLFSLGCCSRAHRDDRTIKHRAGLGARRGTGKEAKRHGMEPRGSSPGVSEHRTQTSYARNIGFHASAQLRAAPVLIAYAAARAIVLARGSLLGGMFGIPKALSSAQALRSQSDAARTYLGTPDSDAMNPDNLCPQTGQLASQRGNHT